MNKVVDELNCAVCVRPVDVRGIRSDSEGGGYILVPGPGDHPIKIWVHHGCLATPSLMSRRSQVHSVVSLDE